MHVNDPMLTGRFPYPHLVSRLYTKHMAETMYVHQTPPPADSELEEAGYPRVTASYDPRDDHPAPPRQRWLDLRPP